MKKTGEKASGADGSGRRGRILLAAEGLFARKGFEGASIREIARAAQTNTALIYYYFMDKENLYRSTLERAVMGVPQVLEGLISSSDTVEERLRRILEVIATWVPTQSHFIQILHRELASESPRLGFLVEKYFARNYHLGRSLIEEAISVGKFRKLDPELAPISFLAMILFFFHNRYIVQRILGMDPGDEKFLKRLIAHTLDLFLYGAVAGTARGKRKRPGGKKGASP